MEIKEREWEKYLGPSTEKRTVRLGQENVLYRERAHLAPNNEERQAHFNAYIHDIGAELLRSNLTEEKEKEIEKDNLIKKQNKVARLLKKKVKVTDFEDGGLSVSIDQEWDTSTWSEELIHAGCEALIMIFYGVDNNNGGPNSIIENSLERKERAVYMLKKLLYRHHEAETYVRRNIEKTIGKAVSKIIRNGKIAATSDLLYVLHGCKETFCVEMSQYNFNGRTVEMFIQEAKLAAILIQHTFRAKRSRILFSSYKYKPVLEGFGSMHEVKMSRLSLINSRSSELRERWRAMHHKGTRSSTSNITRDKNQMSHRNNIGGMRGPVYLTLVYSHLALEIVLRLTSPEAGKFAHGNREDVVRSNGCIVLTTYLANTTSKLCFVTVEILKNISHVSESLEPMLQTGCIDSCCRVLKYMRLIGVGKTVMKVKKNDDYPPKKIYMSSISIISNLGILAAGLYRANNKYGYIKEVFDGVVEKVDYLVVLNHCSNKSLLFEYIEKYLGHINLLKELSTAILCTTLKDVLLQLLYALFTLLCSHSHNNTVAEVTAMAGTLMIHLVKLLHDSDERISNMSLCIFLQICTLESSRLSLMISHFPKYINPLNSFYINRKNYDKYINQRSILVIVAMMRQYEWRFYDPQELPQFMLNGENKNEYNDIIRKSIYLDILKTMKAPDLELSDKFQIADLIILPTNEFTSCGMSKASLSFGVKDVITFVCHPDDINYSEVIPLEESSVSCTIFEGFSSYPETALHIYSSSLINFIGKYLFLCKYLFLGKPMADTQIMVIFNGIISAAKALKNFAAACSQSKEMSDADSFIQTERKTELITTCIFFVNTLSTSHPKLDPSTKELQVNVGISCLGFLSAYAKMLISINGKSRVSNLSDMYQAATCVIDLIRYLKVVHGTAKYIVSVFEQMCQLMYEITLTKEASYIAVQEWKIFEALNIYLPPPLNEISYRSQVSIDDDNDNDNKVNNKAYKIELNTLTSSFFKLITNLSQNDDGRRFILVDGYLRRSLEKASIIFDYFTNCNKIIAKISNWDKIREELLSCLKVISGMANYTNQMYGSANDLIFSFNFDIFNLCKSIITSRKEIQRSDDLVTFCYEVVSLLSYDTARITEYIEKYNIYNILRDEIQLSVNYTSKCAEYMVTIIHRSSMGMASDYMYDMIPKLREPLIKIARIFPELKTKVDNASFSLSRSVQLFQQSVDPNSSKTEEDVAIEEYIRTGKKISNKFTNIKKSEETLTIDTNNNNNNNNNNNSFNKTKDFSSDDDKLNEMIKPGAYTRCGISSCGSLRIPDSPHKHGSYSQMDEKEREKHLLQLTFPNNSNKLDISNLTARDPNMKELVDFRKTQAGLKERTYKLKTISKTIENEYNNYERYHKNNKSMNTSASFSSPYKGMKSPNGPYDNNIKTITLEELPELILTRPPPPVHK